MSPFTSRGTDATRAARLPVFGLAVTAHVAAALLAPASAPWLIATGALTAVAALMPARLRATTMLLALTIGAWAVVASAGPGRAAPLPLAHGVDGALFAEVQGGPGDRTPQALDRLAVLVTAGRIAPVAAHEYAHAIGMTSIERYADPGEAFRDCRIDFNFGCYHGVIEAYLRSDAGSAASPSGVCERWFTPEDIDRVGSGCWHGLGHAVALLSGHDIAYGLAVCDGVLVEMRDTCYDGVLMEANTGAKDRYVRADAPLYPCSDLDTRYLRACYMSQSKVFLDLWGTDWQRHARACEDAPPAYLDACVNGVGRLLRLVDGGAIDRAVAICRSLRTALGDSCVLGALEADATSFPITRTPGLCATLTSPPHLERCGSYYGARLLMEVPGAHAQRAACGALAEPVRRGCLAQIR